MVNNHPEAASYTAVPGAGSSDCRVLATMIALLLPAAGNMGRHYALVAHGSKACVARRF